MTAPERPMPLHMVDQFTAELRDTAVPGPVVKIATECVAEVAGEIAKCAEDFRAKTPDATAEDIADLVRYHANAWQQVLEALS